MSDETNGTEPALSTMSKADLIERIGRLRETVDQLVGRLALADKAAAGQAPRAVPEASALAQCIRALDALRDDERRASTSSFSGHHYRPSWAPGERVLRYLADRYDVGLVKTEPCARAHVDELNLSPDAMALLRTMDTIPMSVRR